MVAMTSYVPHESGEFAMTPEKTETSRFKLPALIALALLAISGCSAPELSPPEAYDKGLACAPFTGDPSHLTNVAVAGLGNVEPILAWGEQQGCFSEHGLAVSFTKTGDNASAVAGLVSGSWDVISFSPFSMLQAEANSGIDLAVVAPWYGYTEEELLRAQVEPLFEGELLLTTAVVAKDPGIRDWEDLVGKRVSVFSLGSASAAALNDAMLSNTGISDALSLLALPTDEAIAALVDREEIDAAVLTGPSAVKAIEKGAHVVGYPGAYFYEPGPGGIFVSAQQGAGSEEIRNFQNAVIQINKLLNSGTHSASYRQVIVGNLGFSEDVADEIERTRLDTEPYTKESFDYLVEKMKAQGLIDGAYSLTAASFLE